MTQTTPRATSRRDLAVGSLAPFLILTFGLTWGLVLVLMAFPATVLAIFGPLEVTNPLYILAVWSPGIVGMLLVGLATGRAGLRRFLGRLFLVRASWSWWAFVLLGLPLLKIVGAVLNGTPFSGLLNLTPIGPLLGISVFMLFLDPVEEFGWRGVGLPLMQRLMAPAWAGIVIGLIWAVWHIPAFYLDGAPHSAWSMAPFILGVTGMSVVMAVVYNKTRGSLLLPILIHWQSNLPFWPEAQPWENYLIAGLALVMVWMHRDVMLSRDKAVTEVVPG